MTTEQQDAILNLANAAKQRCFDARNRGSMAGEYRNQDYIAALRDFAKIIEGFPYTFTFSLNDILLDSYKPEEKPNILHPCTTSS